MSTLAPGLLVAAPPLADPNFDRSVVLLASHGDAGAFGWVLNGERLMGIDELLQHAGLPDSVVSQAGVEKLGELSAGGAGRGGAIDSSAEGLGMVSRGGPVGTQQAWLLYRTSERFDDLGDQFEVSAGITATPSQRVLEAVARGRVPRSLRGVLGYAGWGPTQLDEEIRAGAWLPTDVEVSLVFDVSLEDMWTHAYRSAGTSPIAFTSRTIGQA